MNTATREAKAQWIAENLNKGEVYAGLMLGKNGAPDHHLVLLPGKAEKVKFSQAQEFAKKAGGDLPTRREQSLLFANCKEEFEPYWYWSGEQHASISGYAWCQYFSYGYQHYYDKDDDFRARAVRRIPI